MNKNIFMQSGEDEMEFMPIIPLNEEDANADNQIIPSELPLLPLRNTVLFPGVVIPITVGRDKSIKAVSDAYKSDKLVGVVAQKDSSIEEPTANDLEAIGTVAKIVKLIKMPDGGTTIIIQGRKRFRIENIITDDPYFKANISLLEEDVVKNNPDFDAMISSIKDLASQIVGLSPNIPSEAAILLKNIENPSFLIHFASSNLNCDLKQKQQLLIISNTPVPGVITVSHSATLDDVPITYLIASNPFEIDEDVDFFIEQMGNGKADVKLTSHSNL
jgi:ATP-dependent Lon protease